MAVAQSRPSSSGSTTCIARPAPGSAFDAIDSGPVRRLPLGRLARIIAVHRPDLKLCRARLFKVLAKGRIAGKDAGAGIEIGEIGADRLGLVDQVVVANWRLRSTLSSRRAAKAAISSSVFA